MKKLGRSKLIKSITDFINYRWIYLLLLFAIALFFINIIVFYPGYMSADSMRYLRQAQDMAPLTDLQPVAISLLWGVLIDITGKISSLFLLQAAVLCSALFLLATYAYTTTKSKKISLLALSIGIMPIVINISGVIWADNHMAFSLLLALCIGLFIPRQQSVRMKFILFIIAIILVAYAGMVRNNSILAIFPIIFILVHQLDKFSLKNKIYVAVTILVIVVLSAVALKAVTVEKNISSFVGPKMDDIVHVASLEDIAGYKISQPLKDALLVIKKCTTERNIVIDSFPCATEEQKTTILVGYPNEVDLIWNDMVAEKPLDYVQRKLLVFVYVLFPPEGRGYIWHAGIENNEFGLEPKFKTIGEINRMYVFNFGYKHFQFLYEPWFWLLANLVILYYAQRLRALKLFVSMVSLSALFYYVSFIPTGIAADYRYIYWPVIAGLMSIVLIVTDRYMITISRTTKNKKSPTKVKQNKSANN